jgi:hypothetical protein
VRPENIDLLGFVLLIAGLIGELAIPYITRTKLQKGLSLVFTLLVISGVATEYIGQNAEIRLLKPRAVLDRQRQMILHNLANTHGRIGVISRAFDRESSDYADQLTAVFTDAQWEIAPASEGSRSRASPFAPRGGSAVQPLRHPTAADRGASFDDLVGAGEDRWRDGQAECVGRLQVDHQLELGWLLGRRLVHPRPPQQFVGLLGGRGVEF